MGAVNTMRAVLVAGTALAAIIAAAFGLWSVAAFLLVAVTMHGLMWVYQYRHPNRPALPPRPATPPR